VHPALEYGLVASALFVAACVRYLVMTSAYYAVVYRRFETRWAKYKIEKTTPTAKDIRHEIKWGLTNKINFFFYGLLIYWLYDHGHLALYTEWGAYPWWYAWLTLPLLLFLHDAYFFWSHYLMHIKPFRQWTRHDVHHGVRNVSPYSAFSVHPAEGFLELAFRPVILIFIPMHPVTLGIFLIITFALNVIGHSGYEFFPRGYPSSPLTRFGSSATFHYLHHKNGNKNFGLFLCFWDRMMGTMHPDYDALFDQQARNNPLQLPPKINKELFLKRGWVNAERQEPLP
jgi:sterol desaturase/sphingolipid hydroxylase (fatty acid hydroxylase superfamily)